MAKFCGNCGKPLVEGETCACQLQAASTGTAFSTGTSDPKVFFKSLLDTILAFSKKPIAVVAENGEKKNWIGASIFILIAAIFQGLSVVTSYMGSDLSKYAKPNYAEMFIKRFFIQLILFVVLALALFCFSKLFNKSQNDMVKTYSAVGIATIPIAASAIIVSLLDFAFTELDGTITNFAMIFALFTVLFAHKAIDKIKKDETMVFIASFSIAAYFFASMIMDKIVY